MKKGKEAGERKAADPAEPAVPTLRVEVPEGGFKTLAPRRLPWRLLSTDTENDLIEAMAAEFRMMLQERRDLVFQAFVTGLAATPPDQEFKFPIAFKATLTPAGAEFGLRAELRWVTKSTRTAKVIPNQLQLPMGRAGEASAEG